MDEPEIGLIGPKCPRCGNTGGAVLDMVASQQGAAIYHCDHCKWDWETFIPAEPLT